MGGGGGGGAPPFCVYDNPTRQSFLFLVGSIAILFSRCT